MVRFTVWSGSERHRMTKECDTPAKARNELAKRFDDMIGWAGAHNRQLAEELRASREQTSLVAIQALKVGEQRQWTHRDEYTNFEFTISIRKDSA